MKLNVLERIVALQILPEKGSYATLKIVDDLKKKLSFTLEEYKEYEVKESGASIQWNQKKGAIEVEKKLGDFEKQLIADSIKKLDEAGTLEPRHMSLYEKFVK